MADHPLESKSLNDEGGDGSSSPCLEWIDVDQRCWSITLSPVRIVFESGEDRIDLAQSNWSRDLYAAKHGGQFIIRVETFHCAVRFLVNADQAAPFFAHVNPARSQAKHKTESQTARPNQPLLWPKVSALAVWALSCSVVTFIPFVGWIAAIATTVLLILHRRRVRRAAAWRHSRLLCSYALLIMVAGLGVSVLATWGMMQTETVGDAYYSAPSPEGDRSNWGLIAGAVFVLLLSLTVHEAAHAITAWWLGDNLAHSQGRVTLNPIAHIDPFGTILLPLLLFKFGGLVFGYARPVPVRVESLSRHRRAHILISLAGPGSNLILACLSLMLLIALGCLVRILVPEAEILHLGYPYISPAVSASGFMLAPAVGAFCTILKLSFFVNTLLAMFNLIPIPPLDGSWVLEHLFPSHLGRLYAWLRPYGFLVFLGAIYSGLFKYLWYPVELVLGPGFGLVAVSTGFS